MRYMIAAALLLHVHVIAQAATIVNLSPEARKATTTVCVSAEAWDSLDHHPGLQIAWVADDRPKVQHRAVFDRRIANESVVVVVETFLRGGERQTGRIVAAPDKVERRPFRMHPFVVDDLEALVPRFTVGTASSRNGAVELRFLHGNDLHQRWRYRSRFAGWRLTWYADIYHDQPVIDYQWLLTWSPAEDGPTWLEPGTIGIHSRELCVGTFARKHGMSDPIVSRQGMWVVNVGRPTMNYGSSLWGWGQMICAPQVDAGNDVWQVPEVRAALSRLPVLGVGKEWDGFLACGSVPTVSPRSSLDQQLAREWSRMAADLDSGGPRDWYAKPMLGSNLVPGGTGNQEPFGATAGGRVTIDGTPEMLLPLVEGAASDAFRACTQVLAPSGLLFEPSRLDPPVLIWSGYPHWSEPHSPGQFGRTKDARGLRRWWQNGWMPYDDQHMALHDLAAAIVVGDMPILEDLADGIARIESLKHKGRTGAPRAMGRLLGSWADMYEATGNPIFMDRMREKVRTISSQLPSMRVDGPVKVLEWRGPDGRKQVYDQSTGQLGPWWSAWEHGLFLVGAECALRVLEREGVPEAQMLRGMVADVARTVVDFAVTEHNGAWWIVDDSLYLQGQALSDDLRKPGSSAVVINQGARGVGLWTLSGIMAGARHLDGPLRAKADRCVAALAGAGAADVDTAEWWAVR